ncbi:MAG: DinB family protein [Tetrasphaera sp.]
MSFLTPNGTGEREVITAFLRQQFAQARTTVYGLSDEQIHLTPTASAFSLASLLRHLGQVARDWGRSVAAAPEFPSEAGAETDGGDYTVDPSETLTDLLAEFDAAVDELAGIVAAADLDAIVPTPKAPWYPEDLTGWQSRWVLHHLIAEVARHTGHADIIRESIDGKGAYELNDRADGLVADDEDYPSWG